VPGPGDNVEDVLSCSCFIGRCLVFFFQETGVEKFILRHLFNFISSPSFFVISATFFIVN